jgi:translocator protein
MRPTTLIGTAAATAGAAVGGSLASKSNIGTWYRHIRKPRYVPPNAVFPVAWTALYADIAVSSAMAIDRLRTEKRDAQARSYVVALLTNLVLNAGWSWLFFNRHKLGTSAVAAVALTASSADLARRTTRVHGAAGAALVAYPLWCGFAAVMSTDIWRLNR